MKRSRYSVNSLAFFAGTLVEEIYQQTVINTLALELVWNSGKLYLAVTSLFLRPTPTL